MGGAGIAAGGFGVYDLRPVLRTTAVARVRAALEKEPCEFRLVANYRSFERGQCVHIIRSSSCPLPLVRVCTPVKQDPGEVVVSALAGPIKRSQETALAAQSRASLLTPAAPSQPWQTVRQLVRQQRPSSSSPTQPSRTATSDACCCVAAVADGAPAASVKFFADTAFAYTPLRIVLAVGRASFNFAFTPACSWQKKYRSISGAATLAGRSTIEILHRNFLHVGAQQAPRHDSRSWPSENPRQLQRRSGVP
eukprot:CAMPEP_0198677860 /NCGR_PEP_ID=MMETSP1467-20131203/99629_1 /TAXON_ID=1462469 /ORGANISM="unid. sp., Strain CCMP2135" /LENGTH=250 /DNA_ID=CAMNT_0044414763 /DNA_START=293 /DNA_END=1042 /DNA_ORIENTATION=-